jgi:hypothetical protein
MGAKWNRRIRKADANQSTLVEDLEKAGVKVWTIGEPCDLLCRFWCKQHDFYCWQPIEIKVLQGKLRPKARRRTDQPEQNRFLQETDTPVVTSSLEALLILSTHGAPRDHHYCRSPEDSH